MGCVHSGRLHSFSHLGISLDVTTTFSIPHWFSTRNLLFITAAVENPAAQQLRKQWPHGKECWNELMLSLSATLNYSFSQCLIDTWHCCESLEMLEYFEVPLCVYCGAPGHLQGHHGSWVLSAAAAGLKTELSESSYWWLRDHKAGDLFLSSFLIFDNL